MKHESIAAILLGITLAAVLAVAGASLGLQQIARWVPIAGLAYAIERQSLFQGLGEVSPICSNSH